MEMFPHGSFLFSTSCYPFAGLNMTMFTVRYLVVEMDVKGGELHIILHVLLEFAKPLTVLRPSYYYDL